MNDSLLIGSTALEASERAILATMIESTNGDLPPTISKLLDNAPEAFIDVRHGAIAVAIRRLRCEGRAVRPDLLLPVLSSDKNGSALLLGSEALKEPLPMDLAEIEAESVWQASLVRRAASVGSDLSAALNAAPGQAEAIIKNARQTLEHLDGEAGLDGLPEWTDARSFIASPLPAPPQILEGVLHQGCKLVVGGASKARKSWLLLDLALSVSCGARWLNFATTRARVLFVNFELPRWAIHHRLKTIASAKDLTIPDTLAVWNLRGYSAPYEMLLPRLAKRMKHEEFGLAILDPSYKLLGQADENSARDITGLLNALERITVETEAALAFASHFAKGNASNKEPMDRISGSGVFARDPDSILVLTALQEENAYALESVLRTLPPVKPFAVRWEYPLMRPAPDLDPAALRKPGPKPTHHLTNLLQFISDSTKDQPVSVSEWANRADMARATLRDYLATMREKGWIETVGDGPKARKFITPAGRRMLIDQTGGNPASQFRQ